MNLIDMNELPFRCRFSSYCSADIDKCKHCDDYAISYKDIVQYSTIYDVDKVVEQLNNLKQYSNPYDSYYEESDYRATEFENSVINKTIDKAIEIVKVSGINE